MPKKIVIYDTRSIVYAKTYRETWLEEVLGLNELSYLMTVLECKYFRLVFLWAIETRAGNDAAYGQEWNEWGHGDSHRSMHIIFNCHIHLNEANNTVEEGSNENHTAAYSVRPHAHLPVVFKVSIRDDLEYSEECPDGPHGEPMDKEKTDTFIVCHLLDLNNKFGCFYIHSLLISI